MADAEQQRILSIEQLNEKVERILQSLSGRTAEPRAAEAHGSLDEQISKAVARAAEDERSRSAAQQKADATEKRLADLEARSEKQPREYRKVTRLLWGGDE